MQLFLFAQRVMRYYRRPTRYSAILLAITTLLAGQLIVCSVKADTDLGHATPPKGYTAICAYGETCAVTKPSLVAFGSHGQYSYKLLKGAFQCSERSFNRKPNAISSATCSITKSSSTKSKTLHSISASTLADGVYTIVSRHSGKALELTPQGTLQQTPYNKQSSQHFTLSQRDNGYFTLSPVKGYALEVKDWQIDDGALVGLARESNSWNQQWKISDADKNYVSITSRFSGKSLDLLGLNTHTKAQVRLWTYWGGDNQQWQLIRINKTGDTGEAIEF